MTTASRRPALPPGLRDNRGAALVEFAIVALLLFILVFGIIEYGLMMKDYLTLNQGAREGVRSAVVGTDAASIPQLVKDSAVTLDGTLFGSIDVAYRTRATDGTWGSWTGLTTGSVPTDPNGVQVRVTAQYNHPMVTGFFGSGPKVLNASMIMRRE